MELSFSHLDQGRWLSRVVISSPKLRVFKKTAKPCMVLRAGELQAGPMVLGQAEPLPGATVLDTDSQESP